MVKTNKRLSSLLVIFAIVLIAGVVYAAATGQLVFNGMVTLNAGQNVELIIVPDDDPDPTAKGSTGSMTVSSDGQSADIEVNLIEPGESVTLSFQVENTGDLPALINAITTTNTNAEIVISGDYTEIEGETVDIGETFPLFPVDITVTWPGSGDAETDAGTYSFTIELDYEQN